MEIRIKIEDNIRKSDELIALISKVLKDVDFKKERQYGWCNKKGVWATVHRTTITIRKEIKVSGKRE